MSLLGLMGCASGPFPPCRSVRPCPASLDAQTAEIPIGTLMANRGKSNYRISRLGERIAWLQVSGTSQALFTRKIGGDRDRQLVELDDGGLWPWSFAPDGRSLLYYVDNKGDERFRLRQVFLDGSRDRELLKMYSRVGYPIDIKGHFLLAPQWHQTGHKRWSRVVVRVDLRTGEHSIIETTPKTKVIRWIADREQQIRAAMVHGKNKTRILLARDSVESEWRVMRIWTKGELGQPIRFSRDGKSMLLSETSDTDQPRWGWLNLENGILREVFYSPDRMPMTSVWLDGEPAAIASEYARRKWHILNEAIKPDFKILTEAFGHDFTVTGKSSNNNRWLISVDKDLASPRTFLYDRGEARLKLLGTAISGLEEYELAPMRAVKIPTEDGLTLLAYLTQPTGLSDNEPSPLVLLVHGGPESRDRWGFDRWAQFLASRGYSVLQVNFRGSSGLGKAFALAGSDNRLCGKTPQDLASALAWAKNNLKILPNRVAVMGFSYGGYATLASLAQTPDLYACGVDGFGMSNLITHRKMTIDPQASLKEVRHKVFDPRRKKARKGSPIRMVEAIQAPILIAHGSNDPRVKIDQSADFVKELRDAGGCVEYVVYPDEGHGFRRQANRIDFAKRLETFLARHLCGRTEASRP
ncbi:MAG: S9 family peptidase [Deltaproteobacteria bacterium]|nr:S9 family peptidase [Deltaproteobacteria bacterium]